MASAGTNKGGGLLDVNLSNEDIENDNDNDDNNDYDDVDDDNDNLALTRQEGNRNRNNNSSVRSKGGGASNNGSDNSKGTLIFLSLVVSALLLFVIAICIQLTKYSSEVTLLNGQVAAMQSDIEKLRLLLDKDIVSTNSLEAQYITVAQNITSFMAFQNKTESQLQGLADVFYHYNHTSNAEVLEVLQDTRQYVSLEMLNTKQEVNKTLNSMRYVVNSATSEIYAVQRNVTSQLANMSRSIQSTLSLATDTIHDEVKGVKNDIEKYVMVTNEQFDAENDFVKYQLAGTFTLLACLMSLWHVTSHLRSLNKPDVQRRVMAILWMVPVYSITSWFSLVFPKAEPSLSSIRDLYEAYVVYTFIALLIAILEDGKGLSGLLRRLTKRVIEERQKVLEDREMRSSPGFVDDGKTKPPVEHLKPPFPFCYLPERPSSVAATWLYQNKLMAMQFVISKPILALIPFICEWSGIDYYGEPLYYPDENSVNWQAARLYIYLFSNISVAFAFYGLLSFYHGTEEDLAWTEPWPKFLCIKGVVFMTFWQGAALQTMGSLGWVHEKAAMQIQNLLICIEMLLASLAHFYIFPSHEWQEGYKEAKEIEKKHKIQIKDTLALRDFVKDVKLMVTKGWVPPSDGGDLSDSMHGDSDLGSHDNDNDNDNGNNSILGDAISQSGNSSPGYSDGISIESDGEGGGFLEGEEEGVELSSMSNSNSNSNSDKLTGAHKWASKALELFSSSTNIASSQSAVEYDSICQTEQNPMIRNLSGSEIE